jgi:hypothetical protein
VVVAVCGGDCMAISGMEVTLLLLWFVLVINEDCEAEGPVDGDVNDKIQGR